MCEKNLIYKNGKKEATLDYERPIMVLSHITKVIKKKLEKMISQLLKT
jgi:hypothetical protein